MRVLVVSTALMSALIALSGLNLTRRPNETAAEPPVVQRPLEQQLAFEANSGQTDPRVKFFARSEVATVFLTPSETVIRVGQPPADSAKAHRRENEVRTTSATRAHKRGSEASVRDSVIRAKLVGGNSRASFQVESRLPGVSNYFIGNDPTKWRTQVPTYSRVRQKDVYPGIDVTYYGKGGTLEYDFVVSPGADPAKIRKCFTGWTARRVDGETGDLVLEVGDQEMREKRPIAYQERHGIRTAVQAEWQLHPDESPASTVVAGFQLGPYDRSRPLVIDPVFVYSTYLGGNLLEYNVKIDYDTYGSVYICGSTTSINFPTTAPGSPRQSSDAFVSKFSPNGDSLEYSTIIGGNNADETAGVTVDTSGNAYVVGTTYSTNYPAVSPTGPVRQDPGDGKSDAFLTKLSPTGGALQYSTYLGGNGDDFGSGIAVDDANRPCLVGYTESSNFEKVNAIQSTYGGLRDAFVSKFNFQATQLTFSTYLGGPGLEQANAVFLDDQRNLLVTGRSSGGIPMAHAYQDSVAGNSDAFVMKLPPSGGNPIFSTYLGGTSDDSGNDITADVFGNIYVTGGTFSNDFPIVNGFKEHDGGVNEDAFVAKFSQFGASLLCSTCIGGRGQDVGKAIGVDSDGNIVIAGDTTSVDFPLFRAMAMIRSGEDAFVAKLIPDGSALIYSTFVAGAEGSTFSSDLVIDLDDNVYLVGTTASEFYPTKNAAYPEHAGDVDVFISKIVPYDSPGSPTAVAKSSSTVQVSWQDSSNGEEGFQIQRQPPGEGFATVVTLPQGSTTFLDEGVSPDRTYQYRIRAFGPQGYSTWAVAPNLATTPPEPPAAPSGLFVTAEAANQLSVKWTDNATNETGYLLQRSPDGNSWSQIMDGTSNTIGFTDTGLGNGKTYYYRVRAYNSGGPSSWSQTATGVTLPVLPSAPADLRAFPQTTSTVLLLWADRSTNETGFKVERRVGTTGNWVRFQATGVNQVTWLENGLAADTLYTFRVRSFNARGESAYSNEIQVRTLPQIPATPSNLTATPLSNRVVALAWTDNSANESEFRIERKQGPATYAQIAVITANGTSYYDSAVAPSTTYTYRMRAVNAGGSSVYTSQVNGATPAGATVGILKVSPTALRFGEIGEGETIARRLTISNTGKGRLKVVVAQLAPPFQVIGSRSFTLKPREQKALKVCYTARAGSEASSTTLGVAGSGRTNPVVYVSVTAD